jgi:ATP-dependent Clp protease adaptor protein ClpS
MTPTPNNPSQPVPTDNPRYLAQLRQWNVVLINDADHSYNYVTTLLREVFKVPVPKAVELAAAVSKTGRAVCMTTHKEHAEFKRDQVQTFGKDTLIEGCPGSMTAVLEEA